MLGGQVGALVLDPACASLRLVQDEGDQGRLRPYRIPQSLYGFAQGWKIIDDDRPNDSRLNAMILVTYQVADGPDVLPSDRGLSGQEVIREVADGFGDDFEASLNAPLKEPVLRETLH